MDQSSKATGSGLQIVSSLKPAQTFLGRRKSRSQAVTTFGKYSTNVAMRGVGAGCPIASYFHDTITDKAHIALRDPLNVAGCRRNLSLNVTIVFYCTDLGL